MTSSQLCGSLLLLVAVLLVSSPPSGASQQLSWSTAALSQGRDSLGAASVGSLSLFGGGYPPGYSAAVDIYNATAGKWTTASLSVARDELIATSVNGRAFFAGGGWNAPDGSYSSVVDIYTASTASWTTTALSQGRRRLAATSVSGLAFFAGGSVAGSGASSRVDTYNTNTNSWSATSSLSAPRWELVATSVGTGLALFAGGTDSIGTPSAVVDIYHVASSSWTTASLSQARSQLAATSVGTLALFAGGYTKSGTAMGTDSAVVDIYNAANNTWTIASLSVPRSKLAATSVGDLAFFAGGITGSGASAVVDIYNATSNTWTSAALSSPRYLLAATSAGSVAVFAGGSNTNGVSAAVDLVTVPGPSPINSPTVSPSKAPTNSPSGSPVRSPSASPSPSRSPSSSPSVSPSPSPSNLPACPFGLTGTMRRSVATTLLGVAYANVSFVVTLEAGVDPTTWVADLFRSTTDSNLWVALDADFLPYANDRLLGTAGGGKRTLTCRQMAELCFLKAAYVGAIGGLLIVGGAPTILYGVVGVGVVDKALSMAATCVEGAVQCGQNEARSLPRSNPLQSATNYSVQFPYSVVVDPDLPLANISTFFNETLLAVLTGNNTTSAPTFYTALSSATGGSLVSGSISVGPSVAILVDASSTDESCSSALDMGLFGFFTDGVQDKWMNAIH